MRRTHNNTVVNAAMHGIKMDLYQSQKPIKQEVLDNAKHEAHKLLKEKQVLKNGK